MTEKNGIPARVEAIRKSGDAAAVELSSKHQRLLSVLDDFEGGLENGVYAENAKDVATWTLGALNHVAQALRLLREVDSIRDRLREARMAELRMLVESMRREEG